jgi:hypothetical protein
MPLEAFLGLPESEHVEAAVNDAERAPTDAA